MVFLFISACNNQSEKSKNDEESKYQISKELEHEYLSSKRSGRICATAYNNYLYEKNVTKELYPKPKSSIKEVFGIYNESSDMLLCAINYDLKIYERNGFTEQNDIKKYYHVGRSDDELVLPVDHLTHELFKIELASIQDEPK